MKSYQVNSNFPDTPKKNEFVFFPLLNDAESLILNKIEVNGDLSKLESLGALTRI